jgi:mono/diheme cytochrome c family protein
VHSPSRRVALETAPLLEVERLDAQYATRHRYRGVPLQWLLDTSSVPPGLDLALLHFENGMIVPLPFREATAMERLAPFVAVEVWAPDASGEQGWRRELPELPKRGDESEDWRPIRFRGNKMVVQTLWHPDVPHATLAVFSPWQHVDRLVGIEFVQSEAYRRLLSGPPSKQVREGYRVYSERCQFCHGVRQVGATFGWDFAVPVPLHSYRDPHSLFLHAKYREMNATFRGLMMPAFSDLGQAQATALWAWMEAVVREGPAPYAP